MVHGFLVSEGAIPKFTSLCETVCEFVTLEKMVHHPLGHPDQVYGDLVSRAVSYN